MAKQFGVSDAALAGLNDPAAHPFPPDERAALELADAMTRGRGEVPDALFAEIRRHFSEPQIVEIAAVIGLFNYFNRFNNALHVEITLMDPAILADRVARATSTHAGQAFWDQVVALLGQGRRYSWVAIYTRQDDHLIRRASHGPAAAPPSLAADPAGPGSEGGRLTVPLSDGSRLVGILDIGSTRPVPFDDEDRDLIKRVTGVLAARLAAEPG